MEVQKATQLLNQLCLEHQVDSTHGIDHAKRVLQHVNQAIDASARKLTTNRVLALQLAALLHDADDRKYFKPNGNFLYPNALAIAETTGVNQEIISDMIEMISWVSCSKNGNMIPEKAKTEPELLWPRYADRLEATGEIGVARCYLYAKEKNDPMFTEKTPQPSSTKEVLGYATAERFQNYMSVGKSPSMLDHIYDKLIHIVDFHNVTNPYLLEQQKNCLQPLISICLRYGLTGELPTEILDQIVRNCDLSTD